MVRNDEAKMQFSNALARAIGFIQIKITTGGGERQIQNEIKTYNLITKKYPDIKGLFIVFIKSSFTDEKKQKLRKEGYEVLVLEDKNEPIINFLKKVI